MYYYSIIIPHYNSPDLLMRCLASIPVREDLQVIVVDDCSPGADNYLELYPELSRPHLEYYSTPFGGSAGRARNVGLSHAKGEYLLFADADDFFSSELSEILDSCKERTEDILFFDFAAVLSADLSSVSNREKWLKDLLAKYRETGDSTDVRMRSYVVWAKMFRLSLIRQHSIKFEEIRYSNDCMFSTLAGMYALQVAYVDRVLYYLTEIDGSLTSKQCVTKQSLCCRLEAALRIMAIWRKCGYSGPYHHAYGHYLYLLYGISPISCYPFIRRLKKMESDDMSAKDMVFIIGHDRSNVEKVPLYLMYIITAGFRL